MRLLILLLTAAVANAQEVYPPGIFRLTPEIDLHLEPVPLTVPGKFQRLIPDDITLNLPPGFSAKVFAASGLRNPRFLAWNPDGVLSPPVGETAISSLCPIETTMEWPTP
jgi:hypothetical protein